MSEPKVLFEEHGSVAVISLNRPEKECIRSRNRAFI